MPTPPLSRELAEDAIARVEQKLRQGFVPLGMGGGRSAVEAAAKDAADAGDMTTRKALQGRLESAKARYGLEPDWSLYRPRQYLHTPSGAPAVAFQEHIAEPEPSGEPDRCAVIGDAHDSPHLPDKSRFRWMGQFIAEHGFARVRSTGDWLSLDCFSTHQDPASYAARTKPTFDMDLDSFHASQRAFQDGLEGHRPKLGITLGNHENRANRYDNAHPDGTLHMVKLEEAFLQWGWRTAPYGEYVFVGGVGFTHIPFNAIGKPLAVGQRANKAMFDTVHGDDHRSTTMTDFKSGPIRSPTIYSAGTALPPGFIENYANKGGSTWRSGICTATLWGGFVRSWSFEEMILLKRRYGRPGEGEPKTFKGWESAA